MRIFLIALFYLTGIGVLSAQDSSFIRIVDKVFFSPKVYERVFFEYKRNPEWQWPALADGIYAFITPDTIFPKHYPGIVEKLAISLGIERKFSTLTFIERSEGTIFIKNDLHDPYLKFFILFEKIEINSDNASLIFHTTSRDVTKFERERNKDKKKYERISVTLKMRKDDWVITRLKIKEYKCCDDLFPDVQKQIAN